MPAPLDPIFVYGNYAEAALWAMMAVVAIVKRTGTPGLILSAALLAFGGSDVVEAHTGAWYDPWWLLAWKAACATVIVGAGVLLIRERRAKTLRIGEARDV